GGARGDEAAVRGDVVVARHIPDDDHIRHLLTKLGRIGAGEGYMELVLQPHERLMFLVLGLLIERASQ
ncbi:unnamed protein product, partial [Urochloa humidicola]